MVKKFITLGEINKKHLLPLFLAIYQIINKFFNKYYPEKKGNVILTIYSKSLGMMSILFIPCIFKLKVKEEEKEREIHKRKWLHYPLLVIINWLYNLTKAIMVASKISAMKEKSIQSQTINPVAEGPFAYIGLEMVLLTVASIILLKYKYFVHHIISMAGFILFGNFSDLLLGSYSEILLFGAVPIIIQLVNIIIDVIYYNYQKYMMEKLFYPYWRISFTIGISLFLFSTVYLIYVLVEKENTNPLIINGKDFYSYFNNKDVGLKIGKYLLSYLFAIMSTILYILNIYYFSPTYILISYQFSKFIEVLINKDEASKYYCIIFFVIQLFFLMIYLEILELNFCNLNKNTKKNIEFRSIIESSGDNGRDSSIGFGIVDINKDYTINTFEGEDKKDKNIELLLQDDNENIHQSL